MRAANLFQRGNLVHYIVIIFILQRGHVNNHINFIRAVLNRFCGFRRFNFGFVSTKRETNNCHDFNIRTL